MFILNVCLRGKGGPAQSSCKSGQSSPTGLQVPQDLQKWGPRSAQTQLLLHFHNLSAFLHVLQLGLFRDRVGCSPDWLEFSRCVSQGALKLLLPLPSAPECRDHRHAPPWPVYTVLGMKPRASCVLGKHSPNSCTLACFLPSTQLTVLQKAFFDSGHADSIVQTSRGPIFKL